MEQSQEATVTVWPCQSLSWRHDDDINPYPDMPGWLRPIGISCLLELMLAGSRQAANAKALRARVDCVKRTNVGFDRRPLAQTE